METDEFLQVDLSNAAHATFGDPQGRVTIANDDSATLTIDDAQVAEGNSGTTSLTFTVTLSAAVDAPVQAQYGTADSTATAAGNDYAVVSGTLTFVGTVGESHTITVPVRGDGTVELDEAFIVSLSSILADGRAVTMGDNQGLGTIVNDDSATLAIGDVTVTEGNAGTTAATFTVTLDTAVDAFVRVSFATADNTATWSDNDYATASGTLDFTGDAGETHTVTVLVQGDTHIESDEFFLVDISNIQAQGRDVRLADNQAQGTIINDDRLLLPNLSIGNSHVIEGDEGPRVITLTVTLDTAANGPVSVDFATADGTATGVTGGGAGSGDGDDDDDDDDGDDPGSRRDYLTTSGTLHFVGQAGETQTIEVLVYGDEILEVDEQFFVDLTNPIGATVGVGRGIGTILDDESPSGHKRWHNARLPLDVDDDHSIMPFDALLVINRLNAEGAGRELPTLPELPPPYYDVSGDDDCSPFDALLVINYLNHGDGEGEASLGVSALQTTADRVANGQLASREVMTGESGRDEAAEGWGNIASSVGRLKGEGDPGTGSSTRVAGQ